jgi:hypothetical protein
MRMPEEPQPQPLQSLGAGNLCADRFRCLVQIVFPQPVQPLRKSSPAFFHSPWCARRLPGCRTLPIFKGAGLDPTSSTPNRP